MKCLQCSKLFVHQRKTAKFCNGTCRKNNYRGKVSVPKKRVSVAKADSVTLKPQETPPINKVSVTDEVSVASVKPVSVAVGFSDDDYKLEFDEDTEYSTKELKRT